MSRRSYLSCSLSILTFLLCFAGLVEPQSDTATFYGGHRTVELSTNDRTLSVSLNFKSAEQTGVLFIARTATENGYLLVGVLQGELLIILRHPSGGTTEVLASSLNSSNWQSLSVNLDNTSLNVVINDEMLHASVAVSFVFSEAYIGGAPDFFASSFIDLNITEYFTGCIANVSVDERTVNLIESHDEYGIRTGCCPNPKPISWCFKLPESALVFRTHESFINASDNILSVTFRIHAYRSGIVLFSHYNANTFAVEFHNSSLHIVVASVTGDWSLQCQGTVTNTSWHTVTIIIRSKLLICDVDSIWNVYEYIDIENPHEFMTIFQVGNSLLNASEPPSIISQLTTQVLDNRLSSFGGCLRKVMLNGVELAVREEVGGSFPPSFSDACSLEDIPTIVENPENNCGNVHLSVTTSPVAVNEGGIAYITASNIMVQFDGTFDALLFDSVRFNITNPPTLGYLSSGSNSHITQFTYRELSTSQVLYHHSGLEDPLFDSILLEATIECSPVIVSAAVYASLEISINLVNDNPYVMTHNELSIAAGTRRVIGPDVITVTDSETSDPSLILFSVVYITSDDANCSICTEENPSGRIEKTHQLNNSPMFFSQLEINVGNISFQHFERFGTSRVIVRLHVQDSSGGSTDTSIDIVPRVGTITLETDTRDCIFVIEGGTAFLTESNLRASTDFEDQNPVVTYYIQHFPSSGKLERLDRYDTQLIWVTLDGSTNSLHSFTQDNINNGEVRYTHNNSTNILLMADSFHFQIQSTNFTGPSNMFCINVLLYDQLIRPQLLIDNRNPLQVVEGGSNALTEDALSVSIDYYGIEELGITFTVTSLPLYGEMLLDGAALVNATFTLDDLRSQRITYVNFGSENRQDFFTVFAEAKSVGGLPILPPNQTIDLQVAISISPVNDNPPEFIINPILVSEGLCIEITPEMINITDADLPDDTLKIFIRKKKESDPAGHFAFIHNKMESSRTFYMRNITDGRIVYCHGLDANALLSYDQKLRIDDAAMPTHTIRPVVTIEAVPLRLEVNLTNLQDSSCVGTLDALHNDTVFTLRETSFEISLLDMHGSDPNRFTDINITVSVPPTSGQIHSVYNGTSNAVSRFTFMDVRNNRVQYVFSNQTAVRQDSFSLMFQYGHSHLQLPVQICILPIPLPDSVRVLQSITVAQGGIAGINASHIFANDTRGVQNFFLYFNVTRPSLHGSLFNKGFDSSNTQVSLFSYEDLLQGMIAYHHTDLELILEDSFEFQVCTEYGCTEEYTFHISIYLVDLVVTNAGCNIVEGGSCVLNSSVLYAVAPPEYTVIFFVDEVPLHGRILLIAGGREIENPINIDQRLFEEGKILYEHDDDEDLFDHFIFTVTAEFGDDVKNESGVFDISIIPKNDHDPEIVNHESEISVVKGGTKQFTTAYLSAYDSDSFPDNEDLRYELVTDPIHGYLFLDDSSNPISTWYERDIQQGRLFYQTPPIEDNADADIIFVFVTDGERVSKRVFTQIKIKDIIFIFTAPEMFSLDEGETARITHSHLRYGAENDNTLADSDFVYTLTRLPEHGTLTFSGVAVTVNKSFTQQEILDSDLVYTHDHSNTISDRFNFTLSVPVRQTAGQNYSFDIRINPVEDDAPVVTHISTPIFVLELGKAELSSEDITIFDVDSVNDEDFDTIVCTIVDGPQNGIIQRARFNGVHVTTGEFTKFDLDESAVRYIHTSADSETDYFMFNISDRFNTQITTYRVDLVVLPEVVPVAVTDRLYLREGGQITIGRADINSTHHYLTTVLGKIEVTTRPRHGILVNTIANETDLDGFTTEDLENRAIKYVHNGDESITDDFQFVYRSCEPVTYNRTSGRRTFSFDIDPVNDEPPVLSPDREPRLEIWVNEMVTLNQTYFNTSDADTEPQQLNYTFSPYFGGYYIAFSESPGDSIYWFTQADINAGRVLFVHVSDLSGEFRYNVTDGHQVIAGLLSVFATHLVLRCEQSEWQPLVVDRGSFISISTGNIQCSTNDREELREIDYSFDPPLYGRVVAQSMMETTTFNDTQLASGVVQYIHTDLNRFEPEEILTIRVSTLLADSITVQLSITVIYPTSPNSDLAIKNPPELQEEGQFCLTVDNLDARNIRYNYWKQNPTGASVEDLGILFQLNTLPQHGYFNLSGMVFRSPPLIFMQEAVFNGSLCYHHDGSETTSDMLTFNLCILDSSQAVVLSIVEDLAISIIPVNDHEPVLITENPNRILVLGFPYTLTSDDLQVTDEDLPDAVNYIVTIPLNAQILVDNVILDAENHGFTQDDIDVGLVQLNPLSLEDGYFIFSYSDATEDVQFDITVEVLTLELTSIKEVTYEQNLNGATITTQLLDTATNGIREETRFVVVQPPRGMIVGPSNSSNFSQSEIDSQIVRYVPPQNYNVSQDHFIVDIHNRNLTMHGVEVSVRALVWGTVKEDATLEFGSTYSQALPVRLFNLNTLQLHSRAPPTIDVIEKPQYGHLELKIVLDNDVRSRRSSNDVFTFRYDDLENGWIFYTWDYTGAIEEGSIVEDNFTVLVRANGVQPGEAVVRLTITPPDILTVETPTTPSTESQPTTEPAAATDSTNDDGFPLYTLIPILGVFGILILIIIIVVIFYYSQRNKFRKKLQPSVTSRSNRHYPWSVQPPAAVATLAAALPRHDLPHNYEFDPTAIQSDEEDEENSEISSQYSEEIIAQSHSPANHSHFMFSQQRISPTHSNPPFSQPLPSSRSRMGGVRSNVSITFSHRNSVASETSIAEDPTYFSLPRPVNMAAPIPIRPTSHAEFRPNQNKNESGYNSPMTRTAETSAFSSRSPSREAHQEHFPSADIDLPLNSHFDEGICDRAEAVEDSSNPPSSTNVLASMKLNGLNGSNGLLELTDPELLRMKIYLPSNPVLKKEEYWV